MSFQAFSQAVRDAWRPPEGCLILFESCPSTHAVARRLVQELEADGSPTPSSVFLAWRQTAGHGRQGRPWSSPPGAGVYASLLRSIDVPVQELPLRVAVGLADAANAYLEGSAACRLKWPNDLLIDGRKVGGILVDVFSQPDEKPVALISFGVNVSATNADILGPHATSLGLDSDPLLLSTVASDLIAAVDRELAAAAFFSGREEAQEGVIARYRELSSHQPGDLLTCHVGEDLIRGTFLGVDGRGFLRLEVDGVERTLVAGEIHG